MAFSFDPEKADMYNPPGACTDHGAPNVLLFPFELIDHQYPYSKSQIEEIENKANNDELRRIAFSSRKLKIFYNEISCDDPKKDKARLGIIEVISDFEESLRNLHRINSK